MPTLNWIGRDKVVKHVDDVPFRCLERKWSYDETGRHEADDGSKNMVIKGDNLYALKSLLPRYEGRVDIAYLDPPYNTGNEGWVFNDNVNDPRIKRWLGQVVGKEGDDLSRHDKWLCMMYPRLQLVKRLLADTGVVFVSIDDNEQAVLRQIMDEIFGASCFQGNIAWERSYSPRNDAKGMPVAAEHILVYSGTPEWTPRRLERTEEMDASYKNPDNDPLGAWTSSDAFAPGAATHQSMVYAVQHPFSGELIYPSRGRCWTFEQPQIAEYMAGWGDYELRDIDDAERRAEVCGTTPEQVRAGVKALMLKSPEAAREHAQRVLDGGAWPRLYFTNGGQGGVRRKTYLSSVEGKLPTNLWTYEEVGHTDGAKKEVKAVFEGAAAFDTPKPLALLARILKIAGDDNAIVLDPFAGSGTTGEAVLEANNADGGSRTFILTEMGDYAEDVTARRVERAISGYKTKRVTETVVYDQQVKPSDLKPNKKGETKAAGYFKEAGDAREEAAEVHEKAAAPKFVTEGNKVFLRVVATDTAEGVETGTGGSFSYYELGPDLFDEHGDVDPAAPLSCVRDYVWFTETASTDAPETDSELPYWLGTVWDASYHFIYEPGEPTCLDREYIEGLPPEMQVMPKVIFADTCAIGEKALEASKTVFRKIPRDITRL